MHLRCYSIYDRKTLSYHSPYYALTDAAAVRTLSDAMSDTNTTFGRHPNDYVLFYVGDFDDQTGSYRPAVPNVHVIDGQALVSAVQSEIPFPDHVTTTRPSSLDGEGR